MGFVKDRIQKHKIKNEERKSKLLDVYGIEQMSYEEFSSKKRKLILYSIRRIVLGVLLLVATLLILILFWDNIFYISR